MLWMAGQLLEPQKDLFAMRPRDVDHVVGPLRRTAYAQDGVAARRRHGPDRMEDLIPRRVTDPAGAGERDEWQRERFAGHAEVSGPKHPKRSLIHGAHVGV